MSKGFDVVQDLCVCSYGAHEGSEFHVEVILSPIVSEVEAAPEKFFFCFLDYVHQESGQ